MQELVKHVDIKEYRLYSDGRFQNKATGFFYKPHIIKSAKNPVYAKNKYIQQLDGAIKDMVYKNFVGEIPHGWRVVHKDKDALNNRVENLKLIHIITESIKTRKRIEDIIGIHHRVSGGKLWISHVTSKPQTITRGGVARRVYPPITYPGTRCEKTAISRHRWVAAYHKVNGEYPAQYLFIEQFNLYKEMKTTF